MYFDCEEDRLQLQHLAGGDIVEHQPLFGDDGRLLFIIIGRVIRIYSTTTGEMTRQLTGATSNIISIEFEVKNEKELVACTEAGEILRWKWRNSSNVLSTVPMVCGVLRALTFNLMDFYANSETACAFVTAKTERFPVQWFVIDSSNGRILKVNANVRLNHVKPLVAVDTKNFKNIAIVQAEYIHFLNYETWHSIRLFNAHKVPITVVKIHPREECIGTGDEAGCIFLWRQFMDKTTVRTSLYHWHHTAVSSLAFSAAGSSFYSGGLESVLVKWNIANPKLRVFLPRMFSIILHITANTSGDGQLAVCTADNGVQIIDADNRIKCTVQEFTYILDDKTGKYKFPMGLRVDPRTNTLVLNGRIGHLQFYSAHTKNMLYNMDIVAQNQLSMESDKILYNIRVTKAAFNIDWMATGEVYNDEEHLPELRLKFWIFQKETQSYALNTNVELPHERGFRAIEFSNEYHVKNLLCATVGEDNVIKIWSLEESDNIYKRGQMVWFCIGRTSYKSLPIKSICFSQDGSLLGAGFGNTLCIYKADTLKLKAALTSGAGIDGCVPKVQVRIPAPTSTANNKTHASELREKRQLIMQSFYKLLENKDETLIKMLHNSMNTNGKNERKEGVVVSIENLQNSQKEQLYNSIFKKSELNLFQKILIFQSLKISCQIHPQWQQMMAKYLNETIAESCRAERSMRLNSQIHRLNIHERFKAKYRLHRFNKIKHIYDEEITRNLIPIMSVMNLNDLCEQQHSKSENKRRSSRIQKRNDKETPKLNRTKKFLLPPTAYASEIHCVQFAAGEYAHLVIICTAHRILIWNLLTLRLQSVLKLSVQHLTLDPQTNLIAAFTRNRELYIFQPNVPLPIYQRRNIPKTHGAVWLARGFPKQRSINLDWQAQSTLFFITTNQEIVYLGAPDETCDAPPPITFTDETVPSLLYSTIGTLVSQKHDKTQTTKCNTRHINGPLVTGLTGKKAVESLLAMATHTMPPLSLLCGDFVKALVKTVVDSSERSSAVTNGNVVAMTNGNASKSSADEEDDVDDDSDMNVDGDDDDDDDNRNNSSNRIKSQQTTTATVNGQTTISLRKSLLLKERELSKAKLEKSKTGENTSSQLTEAKLRRIAEQKIDLEF